MRLLYFLLCFTCASIPSAFPQSGIESDIRKEIWGDTSLDFRATEVPEKWKSESAVILALSWDYRLGYKVGVTFGNKIPDYTEQFRIHYRIKLQDKAAVNRFSELQFEQEELKMNKRGKVTEYNLKGIQVIKPDGRVHEIDLKKSVQTDAGSEGDHKIAVPNLEPGDIIDYFIAIQLITPGNTSRADEELLERNYPVVSQRISFRMPRHLGMYRLALNGAPEFELQEEKWERVYTLRDTMRDKRPELVWDYPYRSSAHFRYRIIPSQDRFYPKFWLDEILQGIDKKVVDIAPMRDFMKVNFKEEQKEARLVKEAYYLLRHPVYRKAIFDTEIQDALSAGPVPDEFFHFMHAFLKKNKIDHKLYIVSARAYGPISHVVGYTPIDLLIKVNSKPPLYIGRPGPFDLPGSYPYALEGGQAVGWPISGAHDTIPSTSQDQNRSYARYTLTVDALDNSVYNVARYFRAQGHNKEYTQNKAVTDYDYLKASDRPKYQAEKSARMEKIIQSFNEELKKLKQRRAQDYNERDINMQKALEQEMGFVLSDYRGFELINPGIWDDSPELAYSDTFTVESLSKKAGPDIILELGRLIGLQTEITAAEKNRTRNVYMDYARSFDNEIVLNIPPGYAPVGLENLQVRVENPAVGFVASAKHEGDRVIIQTRKYYTTNYYSLPQWPHAMLFMKAASDFTNARLLLRKI